DVYKRQVRVGSLILGLSEHQASIGGQLVSNLTPTEFKLLSFLAQHPGRVFTRLQLLEHALGEAYEGYERSLDTHISNLRKKLEAVSHDTPYIKTVHGVGYKLEAGKTP
ncbi:MAG: winged helix-turn-helix domain-containing protein, partial [Negativicutes bacterium]|nr:winged helix-turn-helix domain-containing protein [Negativicutes bacterium]